MAVYKRGYQRYAGPLTSRWTRFLVLPRYAWRRLYQQRLVLMLTILAFVWPLLCAGFVYLTNHQELLQGLDREFREFIQVDGRFFRIFMYVQVGFAGWSWFVANWTLGAAVVVGFLLWLLVLSLVAMASSAYVKWRIVAGAVSLAFFFILSGIDAMIDEVFRVM